MSKVKPCTQKLYRVSNPRFQLGDLRLAFFNFTNSVCDETFIINLHSIKLEIENLKGEFWGVGWREELQPNSHKTENFYRIERWKEIGERKGEKEIKIDQWEKDK